MKLENKNTYSIMYGQEFIKAGEVKDIDEKNAKLLLKNPNVVEYAVAGEVKELKAELELANAKAKALELGIKFSPNIGLAKLQEKIAEATK